MLSNEWICAYCLSVCCGECYMKSEERQTSRHVERDGFFAALAGLFGYSQKKLQPCMSGDVVATICHSS